MLKMEIHDLSDYAASQLHESVCVTRGDSYKTSSSADLDDGGAEVVFSKDDVAIHPSQFASERIDGRLRLIKQGKALLIRDKASSPEEVSVAPDPLEFDKVSLVWGKSRQQPLGSDEWATFLDFERRVVDPVALRKRIFYGDIDQNLRTEVWPFLLEHFSFDTTHAEREYLKNEKKSEYETIKHQCISSEQARRFTKFRERKGVVDKDVVRIDRSIPFYEGDDNLNVILLEDILLTYSFYNFDLGYCPLVELLDRDLEALSSQDNGRADGFRYAVEVHKRAEW